MVVIHHVGVDGDDGDENEILSPGYFDADESSQVSFPSLSLSLSACWRLLRWEDGGASSHAA